MATYDEIVNFKADASQLDAELGAAQQQYKRLKDQIEALGDQYKAGQLPLGQYRTQLDALKGSAAGVAAEIRSLHAAMVAADKSAGRAATWGGAARQLSKQAFGGGGLKDLGRIGQDLQYGVSSIVNNAVEISPALGAALVVLDVLRKNADGVGEALEGWRKSIQDTNPELATALGYMEGFVEGLTDDKVKRYWAEVAETISGIPSLADKIAPTERMVAEAKAAAEGRDALAGTLSPEQRDRVAGLKKTMEDVGGDAFGEALFRGMKSKAQRDDLAATLGRALGGSTVDLDLIRKRLSSTGLVGAMEANRPTHVKAAEEIRKGFEATRKHNAEVEERRQKAEDRDFRERAKEGGDLFVGPGREEFKEQQKFEREARKKADDALKDVPAISGEIAFAAKVAAGKTPQQAEADLAKSLEEKLVKDGMDPAAAKAAAADDAKDARRKVLAMALESGGEARRAPEVMAMSDVLGKLQTAGAAEPQKQTELLKKLVEGIAEQTGVLKAGLTVGG